MSDIRTLAATFLACHDAFILRQAPATAFAMKDAADALRKALAASPEPRPETGGKLPHPDGQPRQHPASFVERDGCWTCGRCGVSNAPWHGTCRRACGTERPTASPEPEGERATAEGLDIAPGETIGFRHNPERSHPCDFCCGGTWVCTLCHAEWTGDGQHRCPPASPPSPAPRCKATVCKNHDTPADESGHAVCETGECGRPLPCPYHNASNTPSPAPEAAPDPVVVLSPEEFKALLEYSTTLPTGTTIGKQWKCT